MNLAKLRTKQDMNYGYVGWPSYDAILSELPLPESTNLRVVVLHHHLVGTIREDRIDPEYSAASVSVTLDAGAVIEGLQTHGFRIALHGHQHVPDVTGVSRGRTKDGSVELVGLEIPLYVIASGSTGCSRLLPEMTTNTFNLLTVEESSVSLRIRNFNSAQSPRDYAKSELKL